MRCSKCGYDGMENVTGGTCVKCGTPLQHDGVESNSPYSNGGRQGGYVANDPQSRPTMIGGQLPVDDLRATRIGSAGMAGTPDVSLKQTVVQGRAVTNDVKQTVIQGRAQEMNARQTVIQGAAAAAGVLKPVGDPGNLKCPKCGYPVMDHFTSCPNCGEDFTEQPEQQEEPQPEQQAAPEQDAPAQPSQAQSAPAKEPSVSGTVNVGRILPDEDSEMTQTCDKCQKEVPLSFKFCPYCGETIHQKTVVGIRHKRKSAAPQEPEVPAEPVKGVCNLTIVPEQDEELEPVVTRYEGTEVVLNRANTEADNNTITSKEQAVLTFENGKWFIENRSDLESTMIVARRKMELQPGDTIVLGDRHFTFNTEE